MSGWAGWGRTILGSLAIAASAVAVGFVHSGISPEGVSLTQHPLEAVSELDSSRFLNSLEETKAKWEAGITFIDARAEDFYSYEGHIPGAISLPVTEFDTVFPKVKDKLPPLDDEIVCYCSGYGCEESTELARKLMEEGYRVVYVYTGGWPEWTEAGLPTEVSEQYPY